MKVTFEDHSNEWTEGYIAGVYRQPESSCPYSKGSQGAKDWLTGHAKGMTGTIIHDTRKK